MSGNIYLCFFCGGFLRRGIVFFRDKNETIFLFRCISCGSEMLMPQPSVEILAKEYKNYYIRRNQYVKSVFPKEHYFKELLRNELCLTQGNADLTTLELGAGSGDFVKVFNDICPRSKITAVEKSQEITHEYEGLKCTVIQLSIEEYLSNCKEYFDIVFLFDVLEHLRDPLHTLKRVTTLLRPRGKIILTVPTTDSGLKRIMGKFWPQYKLEHLFYFSTASFSSIGSVLGLRIKTMTPVRKALPLSYLISVGSNFGPRIFSRSIIALSKVLPVTLYDRVFTLSLGEMFVVYEKNS